MTNMARGLQKPSIMRIPMLIVSTFVTASLAIVGPVEAQQPPISMSSSTPSWLPQPVASHSCCEVHTSRGCSDNGISQQVCAADPFCCNVTWDQWCVDAVNTIGFDQCNSGWGGVATPSSNSGMVTVTAHSHSEPTCLEPGAGVREGDGGEWAIIFELPASPLGSGSIAVLPVWVFFIGADTNSIGLFGGAEPAWVSISKFDAFTIAGTVTGLGMLPSSISFQVDRCTGEEQVPPQEPSKPSF